MLVLIKEGTEILAWMRNKQKKNSIRKYLNKYILKAAWWMKFVLELLWCKHNKFQTLTATLEKSKTVADVPQVWKNQKLRG